MLKKVIASFHFIILSSSAFADVTFDSDKQNVKFVVGGNVKGQYGIVSESWPFTRLHGDNGALTIKQDSKDRGNTAAISGQLSFALEATPQSSSITSGIYAKLNVNPSATASGGTHIADKLYIYFKHENIGKIEIGGYDGAAAVLKVNPASLAVANGGIDGDFGFFNSGKAGFVTSQMGNQLGKLSINPLFYVSTHLPASGCKRANKITYYTPNLNGFMLGVSFTPDTDVEGTVHKNKMLDTPLYAADYNYKHYKPTASYENAVEAAIKYDGQVHDFNYTVSCAANFGRAKKYGNLPINTSSVISSAERNNLMAVEGGLQIGYQGLTLSAAYAYLGDSGTVKTIISNDAGKTDVTKTLINYKPLSYYTSLGASYTHDIYAASVNYYYSKASGLSIRDIGLDKGKSAEESVPNTYHAVSLGASAKVTQGAVLFVEYTYFKHLKNIEAIAGGGYSLYDASKFSADKTPLSDTNPVNAIQLNSGSVITAGCRVQF